MSDWIEWVATEGSVCPVDPDTIVQLHLSDDPSTCNRELEYRADDVWWNRVGSRNVITKYRVVSEPTVVGSKFDQGKPLLGAIPAHAELAVARVLTFGANKYARGNWAHVEDAETRYMDAALRHINEYRRGVLRDSETDENHLAHAICCLMFILDIQEK